MPHVVVGGRVAHKHLGADVDADDVELVGGVVLLAHAVKDQAVVGAGRGPALAEERAVLRDAGLHPPHRGEVAGLGEHDGLGVHVVGAIEAQGAAELAARPGGVAGVGAGGAPEPAVVAAGGVGGSLACAVVEAPVADEAGPGGHAVAAAVEHDGVVAAALVEHVAGRAAEARGRPPGQTLDRGAAAAALVEVEEALHLAGVVAQRGGVGEAVAGLHLGVGQRAVPDGHVVDLAAEAEGARIVGGADHGLVGGGVGGGHGHARGAGALVHAVHVDLELVARSREGHLMPLAVVGLGGADDDLALEVEAGNVRAGRAGAVEDQARVGRWPLAEHRPVLGCARLHPARGREVACGGEHDAVGVHPVGAVEGQGAVELATRPGGRAAE